MKERPLSETQYYLRSAVAGGFAGGLAKTAVAPLERVKILLQTHDKDFRRFSGTWRGPVYALQHIATSQGVRGLFQGHTLTLARAVPHAAIGYTVYDRVKLWLMPTPAQNTSLRRVLAGAITGISAMPFTYPFELVRVRMAVEGHVRPTPWGAVRGIYAEGRGRLPVLHFYRGFAVSLLGTVPYRGGIFLVWETLHAEAKARVDPATLQLHKTGIDLAMGAAAGTLAQVVTYPLEVIRRTQQASGRGSPDRMVGFRETVGSVWAVNGWRSFFTGMGIGLFKQVPMTAISLATWQLAKKTLDLPN
ncbi:Mitochondrial carrier protein [Mycena indigotica]|uniref:Mitochondrial carrier protein n=1 Tax=Mycena indigotica TaxID=2126181 RepID=A0A8H6WKA2_9AGAR|nr:Mitochondrial carrier protein [Mycena indigotica]KAF7315519.1 Mitochondrial carrier protein [Mycena indigotica]